jgi:hypothetical protein
MAIFTPSSDRIFTPHAAAFLLIFSDNAYRIDSDSFSSAFFEETTGTFSSKDSKNNVKVIRKFIQKTWGEFGVRAVYPDFHGFHRSAPKILCIWQQQPLLYTF